MRHHGVLRFVQDDWQLYHGDKHSRLNQIPVISGCNGQDWLVSVPNSPAGKISYGYGFLRQYFPKGTDLHIYSPE